MDSTMINSGGPAYSSGEIARTEINRKIVFGDNEMVVKTVYPFMYQNGKTVLRVTVSEDDFSEADLKKLKGNTGVIEHWEQQVHYRADGSVLDEGEWVLKMTYENYTSGDYTSSYENGEYSCEVTRLTEQDIRLAQVQADTDYALALLDALE